MEVTLPVGWVKRRFAAPTHHKPRRQAAGLPPAEVRRAATFAGGIPQVARAALGGGGLEQFSIRLMQPVLPMLAQPAEDVAGALADLGTALLEWKLDGGAHPGAQGRRRSARVHAQHAAGR